MALLAGKLEVVKASITGSILSNLLLVLGLSIFMGGLRYSAQRFNAQAAGLMASLLTLTLIAFMLPAFFDIAERNFFKVQNPALPDQMFSLATAGVLILVYLANIYFSLRTHKDLARACPMRPSTKPSGACRWRWGCWRLPQGSLEEATKTLGLSEFFVGIILIPLVGNAAEHFAAVVFAIKNKMDLAVQIAVGSSLQVALLVAPILVVVGYFAGRPMDLVFQNPLELAALAASILATNAVVRDGESHWLEGVMLLGVYALLAFAFFFTPK